jgi:DDE superfamily endonuclease
MAAVGPPNNVAAALTAMEQHTGRVNVAEFARLFNIPRSTLADAWAKLRDFQSTRAGEEENYATNLAHHRIDGRGRNTNRSLTDAEEENVIEQLKENYPHGFADEDIRRLCHSEQHELRSKPNQLGQHFITRFKHRHGITRAKFLTRSRTLEVPSLNFEADVNNAIEYIDKFNQLAAQIDPSLIINCDETPAYVKNTPTHANHFPHSGQPWQWIRASSRLKITVLAACTAAGKMLKPTIVAKGKTEECERNFGKLAKGAAFLQHTESGLTTTQSFLEWINAIVAPYTNGRHAVLVLDQWPAHITDSVKDRLRELNITMLEVPARGTALLQPLDAGVFGVAKKQIQAHYKENMFLSDWTEPDKWESTVECVRTLLAVRRVAILRGWQLAFPNFEDELKKRNMLYWIEKKTRNP